MHDTTNQWPYRSLWLRRIEADFPSRLPLHEKAPQVPGEFLAHLARNYNGFVVDTFEWTYENTGFVNVTIIFAHFKKELQWFGCGHVFVTLEARYKHQGFVNFIFELIDNGQES